MFAAINQFLTGTAAGYFINKSLRFRASASAYLSRTPAGAGNTNTWTWSGWVKRGTTSTQMLYNTSSTGSSNSSLGQIYFVSEALCFFQYNTPTTYTNIITTQVFRDFAAWYHIIVAYDDTQATASDRVKIYVNGAQVTSFSTATYPTASFGGYFNRAQPTYFAKDAEATPAPYFDGEMAEVNFVDGQALAPTSFGAYSTYNQWLPKKYAGTYGTNGFYLPFTNTTSTSTLVADSSGNGNNWTPNNISLTAGSTYDSLTDVPTLTSTTVANYAVLNPNANPQSATISSANLATTYYPASAGGPSSTIGVSSGKWYFEFTPTVTVGASGGLGVGIINKAWLSSGNWFDVGQQAYFYYFNSSNTATKYFNGTSTSLGAYYLSPGDIGAIAFDIDTLNIYLYKNNVQVGTGTLPSGQTWFASSGNGSSGAQTYGAYYNFGQQPFTYTPPTGFLALNTYNI